MVYFAVLLITFTNFWVWKILSENVLLGVLIICLSLLLFLLYNTNCNNSYVVVSTVIIFLIISIFLIKTNFDKNIFTISSTEQRQQGNRHGYLSRDLGILFKNKYSLRYYKDWSLPISKINQNIFWNLDPNLYFFASHPRERAGINEFEKYSLIFLPLFVFGVIEFIRRKSVLVISYLTSAAVVSAFINPSINVGPILFFPLLNLIILIGVIKSIVLLRLRRREND